MGIFGRGWRAERVLARRGSYWTHHLLVCGALAVFAAARVGADVVTWENGNGNWSVPTNWSNNQTPGPDDDVNNSTGSTITHGTGDHTIRSFGSNGGLTLSGGSISASQPPAVSTFRVNNTFLISGGTLRGFRVLAGTGGQPIRFANHNNNFLDDITSDADLDLATAIGVARVVNGLTLNGTANVGSGSVLAFGGGDQTLGGNGAVVFGAGGGNRLSIDGNSALTLGPNTVLRGQNASIGPAVFLSGAGKLVNQGRISVDVAGGAFTIDPASPADDSVLNSGTIEAKNGGTLNLNSSVTNTNTVTPGRITADAASRINQNGVRLTGGTISVAAGGKFVPTNNNANFLSNVAFTGDIDMASATAVERVSSGLRLIGTINVDSGSVLSFDNSQSLFGAATIVLGNGPSNRVALEGNSIVNLGHEVVIRGKNGSVGAAVFLSGAGELQNMGMISADVDAGTITVQPPNLLNSGIFQAINGGTLAITGQTSTNAGTITVGNGVGVSKLVLGSNMTASGVGRVEVMAGNQMQFSGGRLTGGVLNVQGTLSFTNNSNNILTSVIATVNNIDLATATGVARFMFGALTLNGTASLGNSSVLAFQGDQTLAGSGQVVFGAAANNRLSLDGTTTLTIAPGIALRGQNANIGPAQHLSGVGKLVNQGKISADTAGGIFNLSMPGSAADAIRNSGTLEAKSGGTLNVNSNVINSGGGNITVGDANGRVNINGVRITGGFLHNTGGTLAFSNNSSNYLDGVTANGTLDLKGPGVVRILNALALNGTIEIANGGVLAFEGDQTLDTGTILAGAGANNRLGIEANTTLTIGNEAVIRGQNLNLGNAVFASGNGKLINHGIISAEVDGGVFNLDVGSAAPDAITNTVFIQAMHGGVINLNSNLVQTGIGQMSAEGAGSRITQNGVMITGGRIVAGLGGSRFSPSNSASNFLIGVKFDGEMDLKTQQSVERVLGGLTLNGRVEIDAGSLLAFQGDQTLSGGAQVSLGSAPNNRISIEGNSTLIVGPDALIRGERGIIGQPAFMSGVTTLINEGDILADVPGGAITLRPGVLTNAPGANIVVINGATIAVETTGPATNHGRLVVGGTMSFNQGLTQSAGTIQVIGSLTMPANRVLTLAGGELTGAGIVTGIVNNAGGTVAPGNSPGELSITGNFLQAANGRLAVEIQGNDPVTQYDSLRVTGAASLGGTLAIARPPAFVPTPYHRYRVMTYGSRTGLFNNYEGTDAGNGLLFAPDYTGGALELVPAIPGDANLDRSVGFADLVALAQNYNSTGATWTRGDFTYDAAVGFTDLVILAQRYGSALPAPHTIPGASEQFQNDWAAALTQVPEPQALAPCAIATAALLARRRKPAS